MKALGIKKYVSFSTFISRFSPKILVMCPLADLRRTRLFGAFEKYSKMQSPSTRGKFWIIPGYSTAVLISIISENLMKYS